MNAIKMVRSAHSSRGRNRPCMAKSMMMMMMMMMVVVVEMVEMRYDIV
jgi:hypothetical protein